ncbi:MAG: FecR domain-containing protein [Caulobacter sp.]|nr:FecR domain-containing protein [Caulobacter sp.]
MPYPLQQSLIDETAAGWAARRLGGGMSDEAGFERWLEADPHHAEAYGRAEAIWRLMGEGAGTDDLLAARRDALARARAGRGRPGGVRLDRRLVAAGLVAAVAAPVGGLWWSRHREGQDQLIQTALGEQRILTLSDGSRVTLDALSVMRVRYTASSRAIDLVAGRAYFEVAKDATRPLRVSAGPRTVTAVGTAFSVRREPRETTVVLTEGKVAVSNHESATTLAVLRPGQSMVLVDGMRAGPPQAIDLDGALAWRRGQVVFDNVSLADAAAEMNRYSTLQVVVADARLRSLRISGTFNTGESRAFVEAMQSYFPIRVRSTATTVELHAVP